MNDTSKLPSRDALIARYGDNYRWLVLAVLAVGLVAGILPSSSFVVAIPALLQTFHVGQSEGQLVMTVFMVSNTIAMLPSPWLIQRFGMRICFLWTMALLTATSVLGALSPSFGFLVVVRALQGAGTGTLMPMGSVVVMRLFPPHHQGRASGIFGMAVTLAPAVAPTIGGLMVDYWGWRSVSLMPLPFCLFAWIAALRFLPVARDTERSAFDALGMLLLSLLTLGWLGSVTHFTAAGSGHYWFLGSLALLLLSLLAFIRHARRRARPLISLDVIGRRRVAMGAAVSFVLGFGMYGSSYLVPMYFQSAQGLSATRAGAAMMPGTFALALSFPVAGFLLDSFSPRQVMSAGMLIFTASWLLLGGLSEHISYAGFVIVLVVSRVGHGFSNTPLNQAALAELHGGALGQASAVLGYVRQLGGVFGIAALAVFVEWRAAQLGGGRQAQLHAYAETFLLVALISAASMAALWKMKPAVAPRQP